MEHVPHTDGGWTRRRALLEPAPQRPHSGQGPCLWRRPTDGVVVLADYHDVQRDAIVSKASFVDRCFVDRCFFQRSDL